MSGHEMDQAELLANICMGLARQLGAKGVALVIIKSDFLGTGGTVAMHPEATADHVEALRLGLINVAGGIKAVQDRGGEFRRAGEAMANPDVSCVACKAVTGHKPECPLADKAAS